MTFSQFLQNTLVPLTPTTPVQYPSLMRLYHGMCCGCGSTSGLEVHHWLIKRARLPRTKFTELNVLGNVVLLCHNCHSNMGQTIQGRRVCGKAAVKAFGEIEMLEWYNSLAQRHCWQEFKSFDEVIEYA